jgi:hypothetical protein
MRGNNRQTLLAMFVSMSVLLMALLAYVNFGSRLASAQSEDPGVILPAEYIPADCTSTTIALWDFNAQNLQPSAGVGVSTIGAGLTETSYVTGTTNVTGDYSLRHKGWSTGTLSLSNQDYLQFDISTQNFTNINFSFAEQRSGNNGPLEFTLYYSIDGANYSEFAAISLPDNSLWRRQIFDMSALTALNNNPTVSLRIYGYLAESAGGRWSVDDVRASSLVCTGPSATATPTPSPTSTSPAAATATPTNTSVAPIATATPTRPSSGQPDRPDKLFVTVSDEGKIKGVKFESNDILIYNLKNEKWSLYFDASDVGLKKAEIDALDLLNDGSILLSFAQPLRVPSLGSVDDSDIIRFTPRQMGNQTAGDFAWYFDGSDVGLTSKGEDIDTISLADDGSLLISTKGSSKVTGVSGKDEDLLRFAPSKLGDDTQGTWSLYFDGSDIRLDEGSEDIAGLALLGTWILFTTKGEFELKSGSKELEGKENKLILCKPISLGESTQCKLTMASDEFEDALGEDFNDLIEDKDDIFEEGLNNIAFGNDATFSAAWVESSEADLTGENTEEWRVLADSGFDDSELDNSERNEIDAELDRYDDNKVFSTTIYLPLVRKNR